jgi:hypothetical protein
MFTPGIAHFSAFSPRLLVSNLLENGSLTLRDLKALRSVASIRQIGG